MTQAESDRAVRLAFSPEPPSPPKQLTGTEALPGKILSIKEIENAMKAFQIPKWEDLQPTIYDEWRKKIEDAVSRPECWKWIDPKPGSMITAVPDAEDHSNETREQYEARVKAKIERREKLGEELKAMAEKKKAEDTKDKHWTDRLRPWPGAHGSLWELKI